MKAHARTLGSLLSAFSLFSCGPSTAPTPQRSARPSPTQAKAPAPRPEIRSDDLLYLEEITGERAIAFARAHNATSETLLMSDPGFQTLEQRLFSIYGSKEKIPFPQLQHDALRNFWTDTEHPRGLWRQTTLQDYKKPNPTWTLLLDIEALGKSENESFVYKGANCLPPLRKLCLISLSRGGGDAHITREFDVDKRTFVSGGFVLPEAKSRISWKDENTVFVGTDFGAGSLTRAGYPRISKEWKRGTPLASARTVFETKDTDIAATCYRDFDHGRKTDFCHRRIDFERSEISIFREKKLVRIDKPEDAELEVWDDELLLRLRSDWTIGNPSVTYPKGSLIATKLKEFLEGNRQFQSLFEPTSHSSLAGFTGTKTRIFVNALTDVKNELSVFARKPGDKSPTRWAKSRIKETAASIDVTAVDPDRNDDVWLWLEDFAVPATLAHYNGATGKRELIKQSPSFFNAADIAVTQHFATSKDGTKIPYFEVGKSARRGPAPTLLQGYGGFEISVSPMYAATEGAAWLERGGVFVEANLRGGGEYGPAWHEAAMRDKRQNAYDDFAAVAEDLIRRGVTTPKMLGIHGGSNGGLLTSVMLTQRPELFGAVVSRVPLTDMERFHKLLAGASWISEYGDPENAEDLKFLLRYSPLHNVKRGAPYPPVFFTTSTKDDRVHPGHARKMVAKLEALGHQPLYYENIEGGHGGAADIKQRAHLGALVYTFLALKLGLPPAP